jgi:hypothetical protein
MNNEPIEKGNAAGIAREPDPLARAATVSSQRQRTSIRRDRSCTLQIRIGQSHVLTQSVHDLSLTGVFVEMNPEGVFPGDPAEVRIGFTDNNGRPCEHRIPAEVVRIRSEGVALKFEQYGNRAYTDLVNFLYS